MIAFGYEECGQYAEAEKAAREVTNFSSNSQKTVTIHSYMPLLCDNGVLMEISNQMGIVERLLSAL